MGAHFIADSDFAKQTHYLDASHRQQEMILALRAFLAQALAMVDSELMLTEEYAVLLAAAAKLGVEPPR